jgi:thiamine biosynthesis lipoprotein
MTKKITFPLLLAAVVLIILSCQHSKKYEYTMIAGFTQGTTYHITYENSVRRDLKDDVDSILHDFDLSLSTYIPGSIISKVNENKDVELDHYFKEVYEHGRKVWEKSNGKFDMTIAPIVNAWGFGFTKKSSIDSALIDSLLRFVGMDKVKIVKNHIVKSAPGVMLDANAIAQGYSVDVVSDYFEKLGIKNYLVEIGGEVRAKGKNEKGVYWRIGIDKPIEGNYEPGKNLQAIMQLKNKSLATSGNYRKFYEENGIKYAHSIDPNTGYPSRDSLLSVTVVAKNCIDADAWATAFMVSGLHKSIQLINTLDDLEGYFIYSDKKGKFRVWQTKGIKDILLEEE